MDNGGEHEDSARGEDFGALYRRSYRPLLGMAVALLGARPLAEEVVQRAFATTFDRYARLPDPQAALRRAVLRGCAGERPNPEDPTRGTERILSTVRNLPRAQRDVVALRYSLGLDLDEIDHTLNAAEGTARTRLGEAASALRASLEVGNDLDYTITAAFTERRSELGALIARPGDAQRRVYRRRRMRVAAAALAIVVALAVAFRLLGPGAADETVSTDTDAPAPASDVSTATSSSTPTSDASASTSATPSTPSASSTPTSPTSPTRGTYTVVAGDGWYAVAAKLDVPVEALLAVNDATLGSPVFVGQVLQVPPPAASTASTATTATTTA